MTVIHLRFGVPTGGEGLRRPSRRRHRPLPPRRHPTRPRDALQKDAEDAGLGQNLMDGVGDVPAQDTEREGTARDHEDGALDQDLAVVDALDQVLARGHGVTEQEEEEQLIVVVGL